MLSAGQASADLLFDARLPLLTSLLLCTHLGRHIYQTIRQISKTLLSPTSRPTRITHKKTENMSTEKNTSIETLFYVLLMHIHTDMTGAEKLLHVQAYEHASLDSSMIYCSRQVRGHRVDQGVTKRCSLHTNHSSCPELPLDPIQSCDSVQTQSSDSL